MRGRQKAAFATVFITLLGINGALAQGLDRGRSILIDKDVTNQGESRAELQSAIGEDASMEKRGGPPGGETCTLDCEPNEGEPDCYDNYVDEHNGGCIAEPNGFQPIELGETICATSGTFMGMNVTRDRDWFEFTLTEDTEVTIEVFSEFMMIARLLDPHPMRCQWQMLEILSYDVPECEFFSFSYCLAPGTYLLNMKPHWFIETPCGSKYQFTISGQPCSAAAAVNDLCENAIEAAVPSQTEGDFLFAEPFDAAPCIISNGGVGVWYKVIGTGATITATTENEVTDAGMGMSVFCGGCETLTCVTGYEGSSTPMVSGTNVSWCSAYGEEYLILLSCTSLEHHYRLDVFDDGTPCNAPAVCAPVDLSCRPGDVPEGEEVCYDGYDDHYNIGCSGPEPVYQSIECGDTICGTSGKFYLDGWHVRELDWFEYVVEQDTRLSLTVQAEFEALIGIVDVTPGCESMVELTTAYAGPYQPIVASACVPPGTYCMVVSPYVNPTEVDCGAKYRATFECEPCVIPTGACCMMDGSCLEVTRYGCEMHHSGIYRGDGVTCAEAGCTPVAAADFCEDPYTIGVPSTTTGTTRFATPDFSTPECGGVYPNVGVWFKAVGTGAAITASVNGVDPTSHMEMMVFCGDCSMPRCVGGDAGAPPWDPPRPVSTTWCSATGQEYLILVQSPEMATDFTIEIVDDGQPCEDPPNCESPECTPDYFVTAPGVWYGETCSATNNCNTITGRDRQYEVTIPYDGDWTVSLCGSELDAALFMGGNCCGGELISMSSSTGCGPDPDAALFLTAGVYYVTIEPEAWWEHLCGDYVLRIQETAQTCELTCPPGAAVENEPFGTMRNGGCEMQFAMFESIACGDTVCGDVWGDDRQDVDWYEVMLDEPAVLSWTVQAETYVFCGLMESDQPGSGNCADLTGMVEPMAWAGPCQMVSVTTDLLPAGRHWLVVGAARAGVPEVKGYVASLTCIDLPRGGCCLNDGDCVEDLPEDECEALGGRWQGDGTPCGMAFCPPFFCEAAGGCIQSITHVAVGDIDNESECLSYWNYFDQTTEMLTRLPYEVVVTGNNVNQATTCSVWIDWNHDFAFDGPSEGYGPASPGGLTGSEFAITVTPPADASPAPARMRIRLLNHTDAAEPCGAMLLSEVEDYTVLVIPVTPGDLDGDRDVDLSDLAKLLSNYHATADAAYSDGDLDGDGDVDISDLAALLSVYGIVY